jgi:alpha-D-ribose 1-methylphosphonate 5-triphosphate synthase subunit PhnI
LGPTGDYTLRLLDFDLLEDDAARRKAFRERLFADLPADSEIPASFPKVIDILRRDGLLEEAASIPKAERFDITRQSLTFPAPRNAALQSMARGETGGMLLLAYSSMRGYGNIHPTLAELRVGYLPFTVPHPITGEPYTVGEIKAISMAVLDRCTRSEQPSCPAEDQEYVLYHIDGIEAMGFCSHFKLPHYVDFLSDLDRLRKAQEIAGQEECHADT